MTTPTVHYPSPFMGGRRWPASSTWVVWSSPLLLLILVFGFTTKSPTSAPRASTPSSTSIATAAPSTSTTIAPSSVTSVTVNETTRVTGATGTDGSALTTGHDTSGSLPAGGQSIVPLRGPATWKVAASGTPTMTLYCAKASPITSVVALNRPETCQLVIVAGDVPTDWTLTAV